MRTLFKMTLSLSISVTAICSSPAFGWGWKDANQPSDPAIAAAKELAPKIGPKLLAEGSDTIFIKNGTCVIDPEACKAFSSELGRQLSMLGIKYINEEQRDQVREKIAEEGVYQQTSNMVDKAVKMGKQESVKSYVTINISGDATTEFIAVAEAVNIEKSVITVQDQVRILLRTEKHVTRGSYGRGMAWMGVGGAMVAGGIKVGSSEDVEYRKSREKYEVYKTKGQTETDEAKKTKGEQTTHNVKRDGAYSVAGLGLVGFVIGWFIFGSDTYTTNEYKIDTAETKRDPGGHGFGLVTDATSIGLGFNSSF